MASLWNDSIERTGSEDLRRKVTRVCVCVGWAVHGVVFEFDDASRSGILLSNYGHVMVPLEDHILLSRPSCRWESVVKPGDYIVCVSGYQLAGTPDYLCHTLSLQFASGQTMSFASSHLPWKGEEFSYVVRQPFLVNELIFRRGLGCQGFDGLVTSVHLLVEQSTAEYLPRPCKMNLQLIMLIADRIDKSRIAEGKNSIGGELWWSVLRYLQGYDLHEDTVLD
jgi:hypothetical protein